ncbi:MAG: c-type cytochrome, partial [Gammaproteobacteria bacterium]
MLGMFGLSAALSGCDSGSKSPETTTDTTTSEGEAPETRTAPGEASKPEAPALAETPAAIGEPAPAGGAEKGKQVYDASCVACHAQGVGGAPKLGDKAAWEPRIAQGNDTLYKHAVEGFQGSQGVMPP